MGRPRNGTIERRPQVGRPRKHYPNRKKPKITPIQIEYANLIKRVGWKDAGAITDLFHEEIPDWRNEQWESKLALLKREIESRGLTLSEDNRAQPSKP